MLSHLLVAGLFGLGVFMLVLAVASMSRVNEMKRVQAAVAVGGPASGSTGDSFSSRVGSPMLRSLGQAVVRVLPQTSLNALERRLLLAGNMYNGDTTRFLGISAAGALVGLATLVLFHTGEELLIPLVMVIGLGYLPNLQVSRAIEQRNKAILKALPGVLDLVNIGVEAGLGFNRALLEVTERWDNELTKEFRILLGDLNIGRSRREALEATAARIDVPEVGIFLRSVIQAEELGTGIAKTLQAQSEIISLRRLQRAEERAQRASIKMLFPMLFFIFPSLFIVILTPAVATLVATFSHR